MCNIYEAKIKKRYPNGNRYSIFCSVISKLLNIYKLNTGWGNIEIRRCVHAVDSDWSIRRVCSCVARSLMLVNNLTTTCSNRPHSLVREFGVVGKRTYDRIFLKWIVGCLLTILCFSSAPGLKNCPSKLNAYSIKYEFTNWIKVWISVKFKIFWIAFTKGGKNLGLKPFLHWEREKNIHNHCHLGVISVNHTPS